MSQFFASGGQSIGASASVLPMHIQDWFLLGLTGWISLQSKELSRVFSNTTVQKHQFINAQPSLWPNSQHPYMTTGKTIALTRRTFVSKVMSLLFNMLSRLVIAFLPRSKHLSISWLQSQSAVILELKNINSLTVCVVCPSACYLPWNDGTGSHDHHFFECWVLSQLLLSSFTLIKRLFSSSLLSAIRVVSSAYLRLLIFLPAILIPVCASSSPAFHKMYSACKLNKQDDNIQPWLTPFPIWNHSVLPCPVLAVVSWPA